MNASSHAEEWSQLTGKGEAQEHLQELLREAVSQVCPALSHVVDSNRGRVRPSAKAGKVGGHGDFESYVGVALYQRARAAQEYVSTEGDQGVVLVSPLGVRKHFASCTELCEGIVEALADVLAERQAGAKATHSKTVADVSLLQGPGNEKCKIALTTGWHLAAQAAAGMVRCPKCDCFFRGVRGLSWHSQMKHNEGFEVSQELAGEQALALVCRQPLPSSISSFREALFARSKKQCELDPGMSAARDGRLDALRAEISSGWDPRQAKDRHGSTALLWASGGGHLEICKYLVENLGCSVNEQQSKDGRTALHWAARNGHLNVVRWLVMDHQVDVDTETHDGTTPLHWAAWQGHLAVVRWLIESASCSRHHCNQYNCCAVHWAAQSPAESLHVIEYLKRMGLSVIRVNSNGHTPLHKAAQRGNASLVEWYLHGGGAAVAAASLLLLKVDNDGSTASDCARLGGFPELARKIEAAARGTDVGGAGSPPLNMTRGDATSPTMVSIIIPVHNAAPWLDESLESIFNLEDIQSDGAEVSQEIEVVLWNDASTDCSYEIMLRWSKAIDARPHWTCKIHSTPHGHPPLGCGGAKNASVAVSCGMFLMFHDADDVSYPPRLRIQLAQALESSSHMILGCKFERSPRNATCHYTRWANSLTNSQLGLQRFRECTLIAPTWLMSRRAFDLSGGFGSTLGDDLQLFHRHCFAGGGLKLVSDGDLPLLMYRQHPHSLSNKTPHSVLLELRVAAFVRSVLDGPLGHGVGWDTGFIVWNAGRDGRKFVASLPSRWASRCKAFCDVNEKQIGQNVLIHSWDGPSDQRRSMSHTIPVIHWKDATPPLVMCVALGRTDGEFERNVDSLRHQLGIQEGVHYWHFF